MAGGSLHYDNYFSYSQIVNFTFDSTSPRIGILPIENKNYIMSDVSLSFSINEPTSQITHSLDGRSNITIAGNTTLTNLPYGEHNVTIYATDLYGYVGSSEIVLFTTTPLNGTIIANIAVPVAAICLAAGFLIYVKKHRSSRNP